MSEALDRPVWNALTGRQADLATVTGAAVRIDPDYGPTAAARDASEEAQAALAALLRGPQDRIGVVERESVPPPPGTRVLGGGDLVQMIYAGPVPEAAQDPRIRLLGERDTVEMAALAYATEPGPWGPATHRFGDYFGIRSGRKLAAMAGERLKVEDWAEVSGVSTWPKFRGQGLASALVKRVVRNLIDRGDRPFLHCYAANASAVALYEKLGFEVRTRMSFTILALE